MNVMGSPQADEDRISTMARQMSRWVDQVLGTGFHCSAEAWTPAVNLYESEKEYCLVAELAGVNPDQIDLRVDGQGLTLSGQRVTPAPPEGHCPVHLLMMEIDHGNFCRSLKLPPDANIATVSASYRGGYLWIRIPRKS